MALIGVDMALKLRYSPLSFMILQQRETAHPDRQTRLAYRPC